MSDVLLRTLHMLRMIPRGGRYIGAKELHDKLRDDGFEVDIRSIQRQLKSLARDPGLGLECQESTKPHGYRFAEGAPNFDIPAMDVKTALALKLSDRFLARVLPHETHARLRHHIDNADKVLRKMPHNRLATWPRKVRVTSAGLPVRFPEIAADVLDVVTRALLEEVRFRCTYQRRDGWEREHDVNPIALVYRDAYPLLVCTMGDKEGPVTIVLHRIRRAELLTARRKVPTGFDLDRFLAEAGTGFRLAAEPIALVALVHATVLKTIEELPIAGDQQIDPHDEERHILRATILDSLELQRWVLGFGDAIEILEPASLRDRIAAVIENLAARYARVSGVQPAAWPPPAAYVGKGWVAG